VMAGTTSDEAPDQTPQPRQQWIQLKLLLIALALELLRDGLVDVYERYVYVSNILGTTAYLETIQLGASVLGFVLFPCLPFVVFYFLARGFDLQRRLKSAVLSLFLGGFLGSLVGSFFYFAISYSTNAPSFLQLVYIEYGNITNLLTLALLTVEDGLYNIFIGVAAIFVASARGKGKSPVSDLEGEAPLDPAAPAA
jgi:hypothetical protein